MTHKETSHTLGVEEATRLKSHEIAVGELRKRRVEEQTAISLDGLVNAVKPSPPATSTNGELQITGPVWWISLNSDQAKDLATALATLGPAAAAIIPPPGFPTTWLVISATVEAAAGYIWLVNELGGENGVDINGVVGSLGVIVTPRVGKLYDDLIQAARAAIAARTILDFLVMASAKIPAVGAALNLPVVGGIFTAIESGTPLGWALAAAAGLVIDLAGQTPDPNAHGHIWANRDSPQDWESFFLGQLGVGNTVSLLSWQGFFSAQQGGGGDVYANRPQVGQWETWTLVSNNDGTVSFQSFNGNYLSAQMGGGTACYANRTAIGDWEKFYLVYLPNGKVALKTHDTGQFVSVMQ
ncbi:MAG TPA: hypothetical protein VK695_02985 [Steroidobacteraceae bacterium]|jgi:hypothetical protein|nr:hypothetical protein [Steroidobacteraceae bacterium]